MSEIREKREVLFTDYLSVLLKWKKFLIINLLIVGIGATTYSYMIPETFKSTATLMLPAEKEMGLGSLLGGGSALSFGAQLLGGGTSSADVIIGLLNSRTIIEKVVNKFNLYDYYEIEDRNYDKLMKNFPGDYIFLINEFGFIEIQVVHKVPKIAAEMANYFAGIVDSLNIKLNIEQAKNNRSFVEKRFFKTEEDIKNAEEEYYKFQKEYSAFEVTEQIKASIFASAELETDLFKKEILLNTIKNRISPSSPTYIDLEYQIIAIKEKLKEFNSKTDKSSIFLSFKDIPDLQLKYVRLYREMEIQNKILEFIYPMYEQAKIDEKKSTPTLLKIDQAVAAQLKYAPKKAFIILGFFFLAFFLFIIIVFRGEKLLIENQPNNSFEEREIKFYLTLVKVFPLKK